MTPKTLERTTLYEQAPDYLGWPSLALEADGTLLCVFSAHRESHVCPYGQIVLVGSRDGGSTWGVPQTIVSTPLDDRDPGLVVLPDGSWLVTWFSLDTGKRLRTYRQYYPTQADSWARHLSKIPLADRAVWADHWSQRSTDRGQTWSTPIRTAVSAPHGPILCPDGRLIYVGTMRGNRLGVMESRDGGQHWDVLGRVDEPEPLTKQVPAQLNEAHGVALSTDELYVWWRQEFVKTTLRDPVLHVCRSRDGGMTWTTPQPTGLEGYPPHACGLVDGRVLLTYGWRQRSAYGVRACVFDPRARREAYGPEVTLADDAPSWDCGYPATVEVAPGQLVTVYYEADGWDCGTIWCVRWRLED